MLACLTFHSFHDLMLTYDLWQVASRRIDGSKEIEGDLDDGRPAAMVMHLAEIVGELLGFWLIVLGGHQFRLFGVNGYAIILRQTRLYYCLDID